MRIILSFLFSSICLFSFGQNNEETFSLANKKYSSGEYTEALNIYNQIENEGLHSCELYHNIGNSYYKLGKLGYAIVYYEKARLLQPNNTLVNKNLTIARNDVDSDIVEIPDFLPVRLWRSISKSLSPTLWIVVQCILGILMVLSFYKLCFPGGRFSRVQLITAFVLAFLFLIISFFAGSTSHKLLHYHKSGIVIQASILKSGPDDRSDDIESLPEGVKVEIIDTIDQWYKVQLMNKNIGWISEKEVERI